MSDIRLNHLTAHTTEPADQPLLETVHTVDPKVRQEKLVSYIHMGGAVFLGAAAALFTRMLFTSPFSVSVTLALPAAIIGFALPAVLLSLITFVIYRKGPRRAAEVLSGLSCIVIGILFSLLCARLPGRLFTASLAMSVLLIECMIYLIFKTKYDQACIDPVCFIGVCPSEYILPPYLPNDLRK